VQCMRADEIAKPGIITDQIMQAISDADVVIADLTGNNPNVMYELGYAHALTKMTVILTQSVKESPFDVAAMRQIVYDRSRLMKDCLPRLATAIAEALGGIEAVAEPSPPAHSEADEDRRDKAAVPLLVGDRLVLELQKCHLRLQAARENGDTTAVEETARDVIALVDRISMVETAEKEDLDNVVAVIGNCAVELELSELFQPAEDLFKRALGIHSDYAGTHYQFTDFLIDRGRVDEARTMLQRAKSLDPLDRRVNTLQMKLALRSGAMDESLLERSRASWEKDKGNRETAAAYLLCLAETGCSDEEFERVCKEWSEAGPPERKHEGVRALADFLASRKHHQRARGIYEDLLPDASGEFRHDTLHNLATVCAVMDDDVAAEKYWGEAYRMNPQDPTVASSFSQFLSKQGKLDLALKVITGAPID